MGAQFGNWPAILCYEELTAGLFDLAKYGDAVLP
jgi:hypothetical protein